ncbi:MAG: hypothetical protein LRY52_06115 [Sulfurospirillum cavolei]|nr:hypothetical protein [Sulfurospirillum cavolei]
MVNKGVEKYLSTKSYLKTNKAKIEKKKKPLRQAICRHNNLTCKDQRHHVKRCKK